LLFCAKVVAAEEEEKRSFVGAQPVVLLVDIQDDDDDEEDVEHANDDDVRPLCIALLNLLIRKSFIVVADGRARDVVFDVNILFLLLFDDDACVLCRRVFRLFLLSLQLFESASDV
jgi:hypothetical protein